MYTIYMLHYNISTYYIIKKLATLFTFIFNNLEREITGLENEISLRPSAISIFFLFDTKLIKYLQELLRIRCRIVLKHRGTRNDHVRACVENLSDICRIHAAVHLDICAESGLIQHATELFDLL